MRSKKDERSPVLLTDFLLARIGDDEVAIRKARVHRWATFEPFATERLLDECEAKREVVDWHGQTLEHDACRTLRAIASVYADHPDCRPEWLP